MIDFDSFYQMLSNFFSAVFAALIGRLAKHVILAQSGERRFFSITLLLELPVAIFMGFVGNSLAEWLLVSSTVSVGLIAALSYLGPSAIEMAIVKWFETKSGKGD